MRDDAEEAPLDEGGDNLPYIAAAVTICGPSLCQLQDIESEYYESENKRGKLPMKRPYNSRHGG